MDKEDRMKNPTVAKLMSRPVVALSPRDTIHAAAARLSQHRISGAPVVDNGKLVGVVTEADLMMAGLPPATIDKSRSPTMTLLGLFLRGKVAPTDENAMVETVMTKDVVTVAPNASIWDAASTMRRRGVKRLPVVDEDDRVVGVVSRADLVAALARTDDELRDDIRDAISIFDPSSVKDVVIDIDRGRATLTGATDRESTKRLALHLAARVPGIVEVVDRLEFEFDDNKEIPRPKDPWAVGSLVKHG